MPAVTQTEEYRHLIAAQRLLVKDMERAKTQPGTKAALAKTLCMVISLKREMRMKPKPKPVDVQPKTRHRADPIQPLDQ